MFSVSDLYPCVIFILGLSFGSFINAFVWRLHEKKDWIRGRSECTNCHHILSSLDLLPVLSWLTLRGKCRYCKHKISIQYPLIEIVTSVLFLGSYLLWPELITGHNIVIFILWLVLLIGLIALALYDIKWMILPTKIIYFLYIPALLIMIINVLFTKNSLVLLLIYFISSLIGGGIFYLLFYISKGKWIGGGDVRLGFLLGLLATTPSRSFLLIFLASVIGTIVSIGLLTRGKMKRNSLIPFGPFLIAGLVIVQFAGSDIIQWYSRTLI